MLWFAHEQPKGVNTSFEGEWNSWAGLVLVVLVGCVANTAGVGGGAIFVPIFQGIVGFGLKESTALSQSLITAGSAVTLLLHIFSPNPKPLIDFSLVLLLLPVLLVGVGAGVLLNVVLPAYVISSLLFILMCLLVTQSLSKGIHMYQLESRQALKLQDKLARASLQRRSSNQPGGLSPSASFKRTSASFARSKSLKGVVASSVPDAAAPEQQQWGQQQALQQAQHHQPTFQGQGGDVEEALSCDPASALLRHQPASLPVLRAVNGTASESWFSRRNAWMVRMMRAVNELGPEVTLLMHDQSDDGHTSQLTTDSWDSLGVPDAPASPERASPCKGNRSSQGGGGRGAEKVVANLPAPRRLTRRHSTTDHEKALAAHLFTPLLSAADAAAARMPRGHVRLAADQWAKSAGRTEQELLQALGGDVPAASAGPPTPKYKPHAADPDGATTVTSSVGEPRMARVSSLACTTSALGAAWAGLHGREGDEEDPARVPLLARQDADGDVDGDGDARTKRRLLSRRSRHSSIQSRRQRWHEEQGKSGWLIESLHHASTGWARLPKGLILLTLACWAVYVVLQVSRTATVTCSRPYWGIFAAQLIVMPLFSVAAAFVTERQRRNDQAAGGKVTAGEQLEDEGVLGRTFLTYQALALGAGVAGGLLGMGGGMIIGPVLLELGVQPQVGSATSSVMVLFSSSTALVSLISLGMLNVQFAGVFSAASMFASVLGAVVIGGAIKRTGRVSLVVLALATVMVIGCVAVGGFGLVIVLDTIKHGNYGPSPLCTE